MAGEDRGSPLSRLAWFVGLWLALLALKLALAFAMLGLFALAWFL